MIVPFSPNWRQKPISPLFIHSASSAEGAVGQHISNLLCNMEGTNTQSHSHGSKHLPVLYYNAQSLLPKIDELKASVLLYKPDIICIVETWLFVDISGNEVLLPDYQVHRLDRNRHGGGIILYVHHSLSCIMLLQGGLYNLEFLSLDSYFFVCC